VASCEYGTDCYDCGVRPILAPEAMTCLNTCFYKSNGWCDDGGITTKEGGGVCAYGTDCADCGPRAIGRRRLETEDHHRNATTAASAPTRRRLQGDDAFGRLTSVTMRQQGNSVWFAFATSDDASGARSLYSVSQGAHPSISSLTDFHDVRAVGRSAAHLALVGFKPGSGAAAQWSLALYDSEATGSPTTTVVSTLSTLQFVPRGSSIVAFGGKLYFPISDAAAGTELASADLATGDIALVTNIGSGAASSLPSHIVEFAQRLFFRTDFSGELWTLDADGAGLAPVTSSSANAQSPACMVAGSTQLYCSAQLTPSTGVELVALAQLQ
jgi:hypothetical protein